MAKSPRIEIRVVVLGRGVQRVPCAPGTSLESLLAAAGILGQLGTSLLIDHYGWFGVPVQRLSAVRLIGVVLLTAGVVLIRWK